MNDVNSSFYDDVCKEEICDSNKGSSSFDLNECAKIPVIEVLSKKEEVCNDHDSDFSDYVTDSSAVLRCSSYPDDNHSQGEEICNEVLLSVDEI